MDGQKVVYHLNGLGKAAFAVAFGLTVGKAVGDLVAAVIGGATGGIVQGMAEHGNVVARKACDAKGVKYKKDPEESNSEE